MKHSRRGRIIDLLTYSMTDKAILQILDEEFPKGTLLSSNKKALSGTKWDLGIKRKVKRG